ncbi:MAG: hypothetical protein IPL53_24945 [Ignavibacteria bacterium]|nr:hypothetical protein [Ignavibacteria bacterium]
MINKNLKKYLNAKLAKYLRLPVSALIGKVDIGQAMIAENFFLQLNFL